MAKYVILGVKYDPETCLRLIWFMPVNLVVCLNAFICISPLIITDVFQWDDGLRASLCISIKAFPVLKRNLVWILMNHCVSVKESKLHLVWWCWWRGLGEFMKVFGTNVKLMKKIKMVDDDKDALLWCLIMISSCVTLLRH